MILAMKCLDCGSLKSKKGSYCKKCGYKHRTRRSGLTYSIKTLNRGWFKKGIAGWSKGRLMKTVESYSTESSTLHKWIRRQWGVPTKCEFCSSEYRVQWANKTEQYKRERDDWLQLCQKCHMKFDFENFGKRKAFYL